MRGRLDGFFLRRPGSTGQEITIDGVSGIVTVNS